MAYYREYFYFIAGGRPRYLMLLKKCFIVFFVITPLFTSAKYRQTCEIKYKKNSDWSKKYKVEVTFMSGYELNQATNSFKYDSYSVYGIVFWDRDEATVIKINTILVCGTEVDKSCITNTYIPLSGSDQDGDEWKICVTDFCY